MKANWKEVILIVSKYHNISLYARPPRYKHNTHHSYMPFIYCNNETKHSPLLRFIALLQCKYNPNKFCSYPSISIMLINLWLQNFLVIVHVVKDMNIKDPLGDNIAHLFSWFFLIQCINLEIPSFYMVCSSCIYG